MSTFSSISSTRLACILAVGATLMLPRVAAPAFAAEGEAWEKLLQLQLEADFKCIMSGTVFVRELPTEGGTLISGRAICHDARQFDFSQSKPHMKFEIRACEPMVC